MNLDCRRKEREEYVKEKRETSKCVEKGRPGRDNRMRDKRERQGKRRREVTTRKKRVARKKRRDEEVS